MGAIKTLFILCSFVCVAVGILIALALNFEHTPPVVTQDGYWGPGAKKAATKNDENIAKMTIRVEDKVLTDLKSRLQNARFKEDIEEPTAHYGVRSDVMKKVVTYWKDKFDWRKQEKILNGFNHFTTKIEGIDVHFVHAKPKSKTVKTVPLLLVHGWPGSVWEFYKILPMLTDEKNDVTFEVICPSIPGYGYSEAPHKPGFAQADAARVFRKLMERLGYQEFFVQGGDWGAHIVEIMAKAYPQSVLGMHSIMPNVGFTPKYLLQVVAGSFFPSLVVGDQQEVDKLYPFWSKFGQLMVETGYMHIQSTKPDTIGMGLNDSPLALASYIMEKFGTCTDLAYRDLPDGGMTKKFTLDELLTNVMIYWTNANIASSQRFYKEFWLSEETQAWINIAVDVPTGLAVPPRELVRYPRAFLEDKYRNMVQHTDMIRGGHFAALEEPRLLADDVISFVRKVQSLPKKPAK